MNVRMAELIVGLSVLGSLFALPDVLGRVAGIPSLSPLSAFQGAVIVVMVVCAAWVLGRVWLWMIGVRVVER